MDRHDLYELCVQSPAVLAGLLREIHGRQPVVLAEDFAGTGALSHAWVSLSPELEAVATDLDAEALARRGGHERIETRAGDVSDATHAADVVFVGNFSIGYLHERATLIEYLRRAHGRLAERGGVFVCDTYGGESAFIEGSVHRKHPIPAELGDANGLPRGAIVRYTWEQREADAITGRVLNALHFRIEVGGEIIEELTDAFVYDWRLWSVPELRDAMAEAGFAETGVYDAEPDAQDEDGRMWARAIVHGRELDEHYIVLVSARA